MKQIILIYLLTFSINSVAQTVVTKYYHNKSVKARYHTLQKDTFLIEYFHQSGKIATRIWHHDSTFHYDYQGIITEKYFFSKKTPNWNHPFAQVLTNINIHYTAVDYHTTLVDSFRAYKNGQLQSYAYYLGDSIFVRHDLSRQKVDSLRQITPTLFKLRQGGMFDYSEIVIDTASKHYEKSLFKAGKRVGHILYKAVKGHLGLSDSVYKTKFDAQGKVLASWQPNDIRLKPFKDNGLCLYGFQDEQGKTRIAPQYESVQTIQTDCQVDNGRENCWNYYIVQKDKYQLLNEAGKPALPQQWDYLELLDDNREGKFLLYYRQGNDTGIMDFHGNILFHGDYQQINYLKNNLYEIKVNGKYGIVNPNGQILIPPLYRAFSEHRLELENRFNRLAVPLMTDSTESFGVKMALIDTQGQILMLPFWGWAEALSKDLFKVGQDSTTRLFQLEKGWIWDSMTVFKANEHGYLQIFSPKTKKWGLAYKNILLLPFEYDSIYACKSTQHEDSDSLKRLLPYICVKQGKYGLFDAALKKWSIPLQYDDLQSFINDTIFAIQFQNKWAILNQHGERVVKDTLDELGEFYLRIDPHQRYTLNFGTIKDSMLLYTDESFPVATHLEDIFWWTHRHDFSIEQKVPTFITGFLYGHKQLYFNDLGQVVIGSEYSNVTWHGKKKNWAIATKSNGQQVLVDSSGRKQLLPKGYQVLSISTETNLLIVQDTVTKFYGAISMNGKTILPCKYAAIRNMDDAQIIWARKRPLLDTFSITNSDYTSQRNSKSLHITDGGWLAYDKNGKLLISNEFDYAFHWQDSLGVGQIGGKQGVWNLRGQRLLPSRYDAIQYDNVWRIFYLFRKIGAELTQVGFANRDCQIIINCDLKNMSYFDGEYALAEVQNGLTIIDKKGQFRTKPNGTILIDSVNWATKFPLFKLFKTERQHYNWDTSLLYHSFQQQIQAFPLAHQTNCWNFWLSKYADNYFLYKKMMDNNRSCTNLFFKNPLSPFIEPDKFYDWLSIRYHRSFTHIEVESDRIHLGLSQRTDMTHFDFEEVQLFESYQFKSGQWIRLQLEDFLNMKADNIMDLNRLIQQQLSQLKDVEMDCADMSAYAKNIQNNCFIQNNGIQLFMANTKKDKWVPLFLSWESLKPFSKK